MSKSAQFEKANSAFNTTGGYMPSDFEYHCRSVTLTRANPGWSPTSGGSWISHMVANRKGGQPIIW